MCIMPLAPKTHICVWDILKKWTTTTKMCHFRSVSSTHETQLFTQQQHTRLLIESIWCSISLFCLSVVRSLCKMWFWSTCCENIFDNVSLTWVVKSVCMCICHKSNVLWYNFRKMCEYYFVVSVVTCNEIQLCLMGNVWFTCCSQFWLDVIYTAGQNVCFFGILIEFEQPEITTL